MLRLSDTLYFDKEEKCLVAEDGSRIKLTNQESLLLEIMVDKEGRSVDYSEIRSHIWKGKKAPADTETQIRNLIRRLCGKHEFLKSNIESRGQGQYRLNLKASSISANKKSLDGNDVFIGNLTNSNVISADVSNVINRRTILSQIENDIAHGKNMIVLYGMGGVGKTSIARLAYCKLREKYDCYGWISYYKNLKESFVRDLNISCESGSINDKWKAIREAFDSSKKRKLLVIDNVDYISGEQDPRTDEELWGIGSLLNTTLIITTRLSNINGLSNFRHIKNLGESGDCNQCLDVFYHYNEKAAACRDKNEEIVKKLCELADYNTLTIELLAKACKYEEPDLKDFYQGIKDNGFKYTDTIPVATAHENTAPEKVGEDCDKGAETAARQLRHLFFLGFRSEYETDLLWLFSRLREAETISRERLTEWLGITIRDMDRLLDEGWIKNEDGAFCIHPLVKKAIMIDNGWDFDQYWDRSEERRKSVSDIVSKTRTRTLFEATDSEKIKADKARLLGIITEDYSHLEFEDLLYLARGMKDDPEDPFKSPDNIDAYFLAYDRAKSIHLVDPYIKWELRYYCSCSYLFGKEKYTRRCHLLRDSVWVLEESVEDRSSEYYNFCLLRSYCRLFYNIRAEDGIDWVPDDPELLEEKNEVIILAMEKGKICLSHNPDDTRYNKYFAWCIKELKSYLVDIYRKGREQKLDRKICDKSFVEAFHGLRKFGDKVSYELMAQIVRDYRYFCSRMEYYGPDWEIMLVKKELEIYEHIRRNYNDTIKIIEIVSLEDELRYLERRYGDNNS